MTRAERVLPAGTWDPSGAADRVLIDFDHRHRRRIVLDTEGGQKLLLDLPETVRLRSGDGLALDVGGIVAVEARAEPLLEIGARDRETLVRIAWHLGNRHLPVQIFPDRLRIRADSVIADMAAQLGGHAEPVEAPFDPEAGAYAAGHGHHRHIDDA